MATFEAEGHGAEFDAELIGGPLDGLQDLVIVLDGGKPPAYIHKILGGDTPTEKPKLGQKVIEAWSEKHIPDETRVAAYSLRGSIDDYEEEDETCFYDYVETLDYGDFKKKYKTRFKA